MFYADGKTVRFVGRTVTMRSTWEPTVSALTVAVRFISGMCLDGWSVGLKLNGESDWSVRVSFATDAAAADFAAEMAHRMEGSE